MTTSHSLWLRLTMAENFLQLIRREMEHAAAGRPARIVAKMNALLEPIGD